MSPRAAILSATASVTLFALASERRNTPEAPHPIQADTMIGKKKRKNNDADGVVGVAWALVEE